MDNIKLDKFYKKMFADQNFKDSFIKLLEENQDKNPKERFDIILKELIIPYAKSHNYNLTEEDIKTYELHKIQELSEEDLENIAGGIFPFSSTILSIILLASGSIAGISNFFPNSQAGQALKTVGEIAAVKYVTDLKNDFDKKATTRYIKNAIGDTIGAHSINEGWQKTRNLFNSKIATPETDNDRETRTGLTSPADLETLGVQYDGKNNVATLTSGASAGGLGCSTDTLLGYTKNKLGNERYNKLNLIVLKGQPDVQLGGTSSIPIIWMDSNEHIKSIRIPSSKDDNFNFVYYPETEQMYVAGSGTPTITQEDLNFIKKLGKLPAPISKINMWGWKSFFPGFRQQLNFDENIKADWKNINDTFGNYQYYNGKADKEAKDYKENLEKYNNIWFTDYLQRNPISIDSDGTLTLNFEKQTNKAIDLNANTIKTLVDRCKFAQENCPDFNNQIRLNFISSKPTVNVQDHEITQITTSIIKDNNALKDEDKFTKIAIEKFIGQNKVIIDHYNKTTTVKIKGDIGDVDAIKANNPTTLEFDNFKAVKYSDGYVYIEPLDNQYPDNIQISDDEINAISVIFDVSDIYSKINLNCSWTRNWGLKYWRYSKS